MDTNEVSSQIRAAMTRTMANFARKEILAELDFLEGIFRDTARDISSGLARADGIEMNEAEKTAGGAMWEAAADALHARANAIQAGRALPDPETAGGEETT